MSTLKLCEDDDDVKRELLAELSKMSAEAKDLEIQLANEESRKVTITRHSIMFFLRDLQNGDTSDVKYRKVLINTLVDRIYLYDDGRLTIMFNNGDTTTEVEINLIDDIEQNVPVCKDDDRGYFIDNEAPPCQYVFLDTVSESPHKTGFLSVWFLFILSS